MVTFASDERGVSEVLGAILVFGLVLTLLAIVQVQGVPAANERVELKHSEDVQEDLGSLQGAISRTAVTGSGESVRVDVGLRYPSRFVLINPPPATGTLRTEEPKELELVNTQAIGENSDTQDYLDGSPRKFSTRSIVYEPGYNRLDDAGKTVFETGVRYKRFGDEATTVQDRGALINGRTITLVTIDGELSESTSGSTTLSTKPLSTSHQVVAVTSDGGNRPEINIPTELSQNTWQEEVLAEEFDPNQQSDDKYVKSIECQSGADPDEPCNGLMEVKLDTAVSGNRVTYNLRMAKIGVGQGATEPEPHYITTVRGDGATVPVGKSQTLTAEVRDRYNNPVSGVDVEFRDPSGTVFATATTDENGHATVSFEPDSSDPTVTAVHDFDDSGTAGDIDREEADFDIQYGSAGPVVLTESRLPSGGELVEFDLENRGGEGLEVTRVQLNYITLNQEFTKQVTGAGVSAGSITLTQLVDGPDEITEMEVDKGTGATGVDNSINAEEGKAPKSFGPQTEIDGNGGTATVTFDFNEEIDVGGGQEFAMVSITVYYEGGHSETYAVHLGH